MTALHDLLQTPCATCGAPFDSRVWVTWFMDGTFVNECPDCFEARLGVCDIGDYQPHVTEYAPVEQKPVRLAVKRKRKRAVSSQQMELWT